jgi:3-(3-hydroxy-phenyl)propionate hydroxylase
MRYRPTARYGEGLTATPAAGHAIGQPLVFNAETHATQRLDSAIGDGWSLFGADVAAEAWDEVETLAKLFAASRWHIPYDDELPRQTGSAKVLLDLDGGLYREFDAFRGHFVLLRPDRFAAAIWRPAETPTVRQTVAAWRTTNNVL